MNTAVQIAVVMEDGTISILTFMTTSRSPTLPVGAVWLDDNSGLWRRDPTPEAVNAELAKAFPMFNTLGIRKNQAVSWSLVDPLEVPQDRTYRNAWRHDGKVFSHDMEHAKEIHLEHIRNARTEALTELDKAWMRAVGQKETVAADVVEAQRQVLRDAPAIDLSSATTPEELKLLWPVGLPR